MSEKSTITAPVAPTQDTFTPEEMIACVEKARKRFITTSYAMSIGEIASMYKDGEITLDPNYQRIFRWSIEQRSRLVESILLGIPIPNIYVYHTPKGNWEVVDGVQRLSTIFEFLGILKDKNNKLLPPSKLVKTVNLPFLDGMEYDRLPEELKFEFKRGEKIEIKIIKQVSSDDAKMEIFQRLKAGTVLSEQEYRNALLVIAKVELFDWLIELAKDYSFVKTIDLTEPLEEIKYDLELILRLFVFRDYEQRGRKIADYINDSLIYEPNSIIKRMESGQFSLEEEKAKFRKTFRLLELAKGKTTFQKKGRGRQFLESYFEAIAIGLISNIDQYQTDNEEDIAMIGQKINQIEEQPGFQEYKRVATIAERRIKIVVPFGKSYFDKKGIVSH